jgi:drug/metabolite transporter (DMT)-like permease
MQLDRNLAGVTAIFFGVMLFSVQDAIIKYISSDYAVTLAMATRCIISLPIILLLVHFEVGLAAIRKASWKPLLLRGLVLLISYTTYYLALPALPLAEAVALFFIAPIIVTLISIPMLGERVSPVSWCAILLGFAGVLVILQPGTTLFKPAALYSLTSAAAYAFAMVLARRIGVTESATVMALYQNCVYFAGAVIAALAFWLLGVSGSSDPSLNFLTRPWIWPTPNALMLMAACGVIAAIAMSLLTQGYRIGAAALVTAFEYTGMIWAPLWGLLFFGEVPQPTTVIGLAMIFAAGVISAALAAFSSSSRGRSPSAG